MEPFIQGISGNENPDLQKINEYVNTKWEIIVSDWAYSANTSNFGKYGSFTLALVQIFEKFDIPKELLSKIALKIITDEMKSIYKVLTASRPGITVPTLSLLKQFANYTPHELFNNFDFSLKAISKLAAIAPYREPFLYFYIQLLESSVPSVRRELLANRKIFGSWFGKISIEDSEPLITATIECLQKCVLKDTAVFTKSAKMGLFNDWTLKNLVKLLSFNPSEQVGNQIASFLIQLFCDQTYGVRILGGDNKLALSFLKIIKPWENLVQMDLVVRLLKDLPDLFVPYFDNLQLAYPLTPKLTMWWVSYSILHIRALKIDPVFKTKLNGMQLNAPKPELALKMLIPSTITKQALNLGVKPQENELIRYQTGQIVLFCLRRLRYAVENVYKPENWNYSLIIEEVLSNRLPEISNFTKHEDKELMQMLNLAIVNEVCHLKPVSVALPLTLKAENYEGINLNISETFLEIQTSTSDQSKWWNPRKDEPSLFTQLTKFALSNFDLAAKCSLLLQRLIEPTQLFADKPTLAHPIDAFLYTLSVKKSSNSALLWELLDQAIQRVVKSPYQYIDKVETLDTSPFLVVLCEQYTQFFAAKDTNSEIQAWLETFIYSLKTLGEDHHNLHKVFPDLANKPQFQLEECFDFLVGAEDSAILERDDLVYKISTNLEVAGCLFRAVETANLELKTHLLAAIPADQIDLLLLKPAFTQFMQDKVNFRCYFEVISGHSSTELTLAIEHSQFWDIALDIVSTDFLLTKASECPSNDIISELTRRQVAINLDHIDLLLSFSSLADNLKLITTGIDKSLISKATDPPVVAELVRISNSYDPEHLQAYDIAVLKSACQYVPELVNSDKALEVAFNKLLTGNSDAIAVFSAFKSQLNDDHWHAISEYIKKATSDSKVSILDVSMLNLVSTNSEVISKWLKAVIRQLTLSFMHYTPLSASANELVQTLTEVLTTEINIWEHVHSTELNNFISASIKHNLSVCHPSTVIIMSSLMHSSNQKVSSFEHLQLLLDVPNQEFSLDCALLALYLFKSNPTECAIPVIEQALLIKYDGTMLPKDKLILSILEQIEAIRQSSWVENVESWDIRPASSAQSLLANDYEFDPLIKVQGDKVFVTLDETRIKATNDWFEPVIEFKLPNTTSFNELTNYLNKYTVLLPERKEQMYDQVFLFNTIASCDQLTTSLDSFLNSGLLAFTIYCVSDPNLSDYAVRYLTYLFHLLSADPAFKELTGTKLVVGKLLAAIEVNPLPPHIPIILGSMLAIVAHPSNYLHEKVCDWLISGPKISHFDIPLFKEIQNSTAELRTRELIWLVNTLRTSVTCKETAELYQRQGILDWCFTNFQHRSAKMSFVRDAVLRLVSKIEEVKNVPAILVNGCGSLAVPQFKERVSRAAGDEFITRWASSV